MNISNVGLYLGFQIGPASGTLQWKAALEKYKNRVDLISKSGLTASLACHRYNSLAVPVLSYIAQLISPPENIKRNLKIMLFLKFFILLRIVFPIQLSWLLGKTSG